MIIRSVFILSILLFAGCTDNKPAKELDGKKLLEEKCVQCHNLKMPPVTSADEAAPPIMAVAFHVRSFVKPSDESQRTAKAIEFVADYVRAPSLEKSFCDKDSISQYGMMPSQEENVTKEEARAIAAYMFRRYTQENLQEAIQTKERFDALPEGEKVALKYRCVTCHKTDKDLVGPSFLNIQKRYLSSHKEIANSIKNGSKGKWEGFSARMPAFTQASDEELQKLSEWILTLK